ncbi:MAG: SMR family transporter [Aeromicrobium sp.]|uniref:SMR family transporter n=1 Tax=Aeromicrobium sp. TaxID=1871063 RepID=UPI0039E55EAA
MRAPVLLAGAIVAEVAGTLTLRAATDCPGLIPVVAVAYAAAFTLLGLALRAGMRIGAAYGVWAASGVALVAGLGALLFDETLSPAAVVGIAVIVVGVVLIETGQTEDAR